MVCLCCVLCICIREFHFWKTSVCKQQRHLHFAFAAVTRTNMSMWVSVREREIKWNGWRLPRTHIHTKTLLPKHDVDAKSTTVRFVCMRAYDMKTPVYTNTNTHKAAMTWKRRRYMRRIRGANGKQTWMSETKWFAEPKTSDRGLMKKKNGVSSGCVTV